jgi:hypothetical protein
MAITSKEKQAELKQLRDRVGRDVREAVGTLDSLGTKLAGQARHSRALAERALEKAPKLGRAPENQRGRRIAIAAIPAAVMALGAAAVAIWRRKR